MVCNGSVHFAMHSHQRLHTCVENVLPKMVGYKQFYSIPL